MLPRAFLPRHRGFEPSTVTQGVTGLGSHTPAQSASSSLVSGKRWVSSPKANTLVPQPKNSTSFDLSNFFIHCESNGISSRVSVYLITEGAYHQPKAVFAFAMMIYNGKPLVIYNSCGIDDIHGYAVIEYGSSNPCCKP